MKQGFSALGLIDGSTRWTIARANTLFRRYDGQIAMELDGKAFMGYRTGYLLQSS